MIAGARRRLLAPSGGPAGYFGPYLYWANSGNDTIGRAHVDGTVVEQSFMSTAAQPRAVRVNSQGIFFVAVTASIGNPIMRAALDGTGALAIVTDGSMDAQWIAVDETYVYIANNFTSKIGRANLDGSSYNTALISTSGNSQVAVDSGHIYWTKGGTGMGRAVIDGSSPTNSFFFSGAGTSLGAIATDSNFIYWQNSATQIGRANLDGTGKVPAFISGLSASNLAGLAVDASFIYWAESATNNIGRANLDGSGVNRTFITGCNTPTGIAVR